MGWPEARAALADALAAVDGVDRVQLTPPVAGQLRFRGVLVALTPPGRTTARSPGRRQKVVAARAVVLTPLPTAGGVEAAALRVDAAVEAIDDAMSGEVSLGGAAASADPWAWSEMELTESTPGAGDWYLAMRGSMRIVLVDSPPLSP